jgi:hypothetical protein
MSKPKKPAKEQLDELKKSIPTEGEPFAVEAELNEEDLDTVSGGECRCLCGIATTCGGGGGGGAAAFEDPTGGL